MQASKLYVKVAVKKRPYSAEVTAISVTASFNPNFNYNSAMLYNLVDLDNVTLAIIDSVVEKQRIKASAEDVHVAFSPAVNKFITN